MRWLSLIVALVVAAHVLLVWAFRYEWSVAQATRNGYAGFGIFHLALASIVLSTVLGGSASRWLTLASYLIVCVGASGAVFRYDVVAVYRVPVIGCVLLGVIAIARRFYLSRRASR